MPVLNDGAALVHSSFSSLVSVAYLNMHNAGIKRIEALEGLTNLTSLALSFNALERIEGLGKMVRLARLDLSYNQISQIDGLKGTPKLKMLDLSYNAIESLNDLAFLSKYATELSELWLLGNPTCEVKAYRSITFRQLSHLSKLDGQAQHSGKDDESPSGPRHSLTVQLIQQHSLDAHGRPFSMAHSASADPNEWLRQVELLSVPHCHLWRIALLDRLPGLTRVNFADNEIVTIEGRFGGWVLELP